ncbi:MAG: ATP-grasp domain-containing protein, partial [Chloroflexi bacterium]|nr:ATP-grasp domain-containing protein [Chloroflexota bacterium]
MKVIVYEHASGGGYAGQPIPLGVLAEGFAMLRSVVSDFKVSGHEVTVLLDARLSKLNPPIDADCTLPIMYTKEPEKFLANLARINDAIYIIAPETGQTLQSLVEIAEKTGKPSLNCKSAAIAKVADKALLYETLQKEGFPTPKTLLLNTSNTWEKVKQTVKHELSYPVVIKPVDGVGCGGLSIVKEEAKIEKAVAKIKAESKNAQFIAQEFINSESASVSLLATGKKARAVSLNRQHVTIAGPNGVSSYNGGCVPFAHPLKQEAVDLAEKVVESFTGLQGYVGVDLVLTQDKAYVVDVNPRLTTSYVGLRKVAGFNVAEALVDAVFNGKLPNKRENRGVACFLKRETSKPKLEAFKAAAELEAVVSPPFPLEDQAQSCSLIIGNGETLEMAKLRLEEAK